MFNKQLKQNIKKLDDRIDLLYGELNSAPTHEQREKITAQLKELADLRNKLSESKTRESMLPILVPGAVGLTAMLLVLKYEKTEIITSKAFSIATKFIRGQ